MSSAMVRAVRKRLVNGCRVLAGHGQGDLIWGHLSVRMPGEPDKLFIKPAGLGLEEIDDEHLIVADLDGNRLTGRWPMHAEVFIHTEIFRRRADVQAVVHTHPSHAVAFSALGVPLQPVGHEGALFIDGLPVFSQTSDLIVNAELGRALASTLGVERAALMRNHGIVTVGQSIGEAVMTALLLEKACRVQLLAMSAGGGLVLPAAADARAKRDRLYRPATFETAFDYCERLVAARASTGCSCGGHGP
ncbi:class II aldolase/adducin family protein [Billgrantia aerodenitrificans]|uniref:Class II aldolase/adducin family protein n=1 Tax=Billgrantia aerodenitrificans TaxID=2733483 RepID=A0ABS9AR90_9GAMM|nr:class II aldolase/adducin family protein [Halomonas aerodenitrificans]MCE8024358.1 class II aldolase/adducin family protein [Halomonas aerodenitrificans]